MSRSCETSPGMPKIIRSLADVRGLRGRRACYTSAMVGALREGEALGLHVDKCNLSEYNNWLMSCGAFDGGRLWVHDELHGRDPPPKSAIVPPGMPAGAKGYYIDTRDRWHHFNPKSWHMVEPIKKGVRVSLALFVIEGVHRLLPQHWAELQEHHFPIKELQMANKCDDIQVDNFILNLVIKELRGAHRLGSLEAGTHVDEPSVWDIHPEYYAECHDTITGQQLDPALVAAGRRAEMEYMAGLGAWSYDSIDNCISKTGKPPIATGWVEVNKGDVDRPQVRSRLVVRETKLRSTITSASEVFSATPPYECLKALASMTMTPRTSDEHFHRLMFIDISRAHPHAKMRRDLWIALPDEDPRSKEPGVCGKLERCLYGTRDAGQRFEAFTHEVMTGKLEFLNGLWSPCIFKHKRDNVLVFVYGDNFVAKGTREKLRWFHDSLSQHMLVKLEGILGPGEDEQRELLCLNRIFRWVPGLSDQLDSIEIEADPLHAEILVAQTGISSGKGVVSPGVPAKDAETGRPLGVKEATLFRSLCMRANYLSADRPELSFASKEAARHMAAPCEAGMALVKRISRFLLKHPRTVQVMKRQRPPTTLRGFSDADHAGCLRTRKSSSCSVIMYGDHQIKFLSATQQPIALSSAESEWYAMVRTATVAIGMANMFLDYGLSVKVELLGDATAASGIACRRGVGKVRHLETSTLWLQRLVLDQKVKLARQPGASNMADIGTKHVPATLMWQHLSSMGYEAREGKSGIALRAAL